MTTATTAAAQHPAGLDGTSNVESSSSLLSPKKVPGISIAELRSKFQKDNISESNNVVSGIGSSSPVTKQQHQPCSKQPSVPVKKKPNDGSLFNSPSKTLISLQPDIVREIHHKFNNATHGTGSTLPKKQNVEEKVTKETTTTTNGVGVGGRSSPSHVVGYCAKRVVKPALPTKNITSPYKVQSSKSPSKSDTTTENTQDTTTISTSKVYIKPNQSHLSSLISEIHQQQLHQQIQNHHQQQNESKETTKTTTVVASHKPLPLVPTSRSESPPLQLQRKALSVDLGPPPPVPSTNSSSSSLASNAQLVSSSPLLCCKWKRVELPSLAKLGPPPIKPLKPPFVRLPTSKLTTAASVASTVTAGAAVAVEPTPPLPQRNPVRSASLPLPPRPLKLTCNSSGVLQNSELQDLMITADNKSLPSSPIPEFTEEEELGDGNGNDFYDDTGPNRASSLVSNDTAHSSGGSVSHISQQDELYQDALILSAEDVYEDIGVANPAPLSDVSSLTYSTRKEDERRRRDDERRLKREQKEREKKLREMDKLRKKFNLTGNEVPVDMGIVKETVKSRRRDDLLVKKGERLIVLRINENPVGKWLARNDDGKVGYVDLTNIEVDADSIRYVMSQSRSTTILSNGTDILSEIYDDGDSGEAIYEEFS